MRVVVFSFINALDSMNSCDSHWQVLEARLFCANWSYLSVLTMNTLNEHHSRSQQDYPRIPRALNPDCGRSASSKKYLYLKPGLLKKPFCKQGCIARFRSNDQ